MALVTTDFWIQLFHRVTAVGPLGALSSIEVVSVQAPDHTVGPGIWYVVMHDLVSDVVLVEQ